MDLLTSIDGVTFAEAWDSRVERNVDGLQVHFLGRERLIRNGRATGRPQDLADVARLASG